MDSVATYAQAVLGNQWTYYFKYSTSATWYDTSNAQVYIGPTEYLGYGGAAIAFLASFLGAMEVAGQTLVQIEESLDVWLGGYAEGNYDEILKSADDSDAMQQFLVGFTWDLIVYSLALFWHAFFTMTVGFITGIYIMYKLYTKVGTD